MVSIILSYFPRLASANPWKLLLILAIVTLFPYFFHKRLIGPITGTARGEPLPHPETSLFSA